MWIHIHSTKARATDIRFLKTRKTWPKGEEAILREAVKIWMEIHPEQTHFPATDDDDLWDDIVMYCRSAAWRPRGTSGPFNRFKPGE